MGRAPRSLMTVEIQSWVASDWLAKRRRPLIDRHVFGSVWYSSANLESTLSQRSRGGPARNTGAWEPTET
jgi:hypothetical protein